MIVTPGIVAFIRQTIRTRLRPLFRKVVRVVLRRHAAALVAHRTTFLVSMRTLPILILLRLKLAFGAVG
jgi:hypothetical protein